MTFELIVTAVLMIFGLWNSTRPEVFNLPEWE